MRARARTRPEKPGVPAKAASRTHPTPKSAAAPRAKAEKPEVRIFVSYSHRDAEARRRLGIHLAPLERDNVRSWFDGDMDAGDKLDTGIARALRDAHVFVGLLSPDYLASNYCWKIEYRRAMNRRARGAMRVVAVVVRPCDWKSTPAAGFKLLPEDGRDVTRWRSADEAYLNVAQGIRRVVAAVRKDMAAAPARPVRAKRAVPKTRPGSPTKPASPVKPQGSQSVTRSAPGPARKKPVRGPSKA
ncbi:hypothetical protein MBRA_04244 [Methylobacterium brachiatum]|nr:hypothetical protein MBRA_04244 [Methylobacterium brachiatum]